MGADVILDDGPSSEVDGEVRVRWVINRGLHVFAYVVTKLFCLDVRCERTSAALAGCYVINVVIFSRIAA
jgi:hypothetical protein